MEYKYRIMEMILIFRYWKYTVVFFPRETGWESSSAPGADSSLSSVPVFQSVTFENVSTTSYLALAYHDHRTCELIVIQLGSKSKL